VRQQFGEWDPPVAMSTVLPRIDPEILPQSFAFSDQGSLHIR